MDARELHVAPGSTPPPHRPQSSDDDFSDVPLPETLNEPNESTGDKKHTRKKLLVVLAIIVAITIVATTVFYVFDTKKAIAPSDSSAEQTVPLNQSVNAALKTLTENTTAEGTLTNTDDTVEATSASTNAGVVGDSVDENDI